MARKAKVSLAFVRYTIPQKLVFGVAVQGGLTDNSTIFTTPDPTVVQLQTATDELDAAAAAAESGDHAKVQLMYQKEADWDDLFRSSAAYVNKVAAGNEATILLSGFKATKTEPEPLQKPGPLANLKVTAGNLPGSINVECAPMKNVRSFVFFIGQNNNDPGIQIINNQVVIPNYNGLFAFMATAQRKVTFEGLPQRNDVVVVGYAVNTAGAGPLSDPIDVLVP